MSKKYVMGNQAIAMGAIKAGVNLCCGYPGTPSSEIIETVAKYNKEGKIHVEWSVNEKAALEVATAASYSGARTLVTMKMVGLNVAADPLMSLAYVGVKGGMVIVVADDPGPISSQTEQDTRMYAELARIPVFDPVSPEDAFEMIEEAFSYSEKYHTPVIFRPTTRIDHAYAAIDFDEIVDPKAFEGFVKDSKKWVIFPRLSRMNHEMIEKRNPLIGKDFSSYKRNTVEGNGSLAVICSGINYQYTKEALKSIDEKVKLIRIGTPYPFPEDFVKDTLDGVDEVLCVEELEPFLEEKLFELTGLNKLNISIKGKRSGNAPLAGENSTDIVKEMLEAFFTGKTLEELKEKNSGEAVNKDSDRDSRPAPPMRPPVLCAGCPHRASFYAVKQAMKGRKANFCGDIGCYTLGNAMPLDMVDTCLCMGAGINMAQGFHWTNEDTVNFAFVGDSTFFASGMTGVVNAVYNDADMVLCVLDNSTTAMTGHQPHPGTGINMMGDIVAKISIEAILKAVGLKKVITVDPLKLDEAVNAVKECADTKGVTAVIFKSPCIALYKPEKKFSVSEKCVNCLKCIKEIGCPAIVREDGKIKIDTSLCTGCGLCSKICPLGAINPVEDKNFGGQIKADDQKTDKEDK